MNLNSLTASYVKDVLNFTKKFHLDYARVEFEFNDDVWSCTISKPKNSIQLMFYNGDGDFESMILGKDDKKVIEEFKESKFYKAKIVIE